MTAGALPAPAVPLAPEPSPALPGFLPYAFTLLLALPFHPYWLDFELARMGLLLLLAGASLLAWPGAAGWLGARACRPQRLLLVWLLVGLGWGAFGGNAWEAALRAAQGLAFLHVAALGAASPQRGWQRAALLTLLLAAGFGLLQRLGLAEIAGYGTVAEPVSVFGNRNVAAEVVAVLVAAAGGLLAPQPKVALPAIALGLAYLTVNGSRSALWLALPASALWLLATATGPDRRRLLPRLLLAAGAGTGAGWLLERVAPEVTIPEPAAAAQPFVQQQPTATIQVRWEIAQSCARMLGDAPFFGHGLGQFAVQYPRYRSEAEIEASSYGRRFATEVRTAHDDWLELPVEGGLPLLLLLLWCGQRWFAAHRGQPARLLPLVALATLMLVRAPLHNAPAAALAFALAAPPLPDARLGGRSRWLARALGALLLPLGAMVLLGNLLFAPYQRARARGEPLPDAAATLATASALLPFEPRFHHLRAQELRARATGDAGASEALAAIDAAVRLRPHEPAYRLLRADLLRLLRRFAEAGQELLRAAALDPGDPQILVSLAGVSFTAGNREDVVVALYTDPPPSLREVLAKTFDDFAAQARALGDKAWERRYFAEACLRRALDATGGADAKKRALAGVRSEIASEACRNAGMSTDVRVRALMALLALDVGDAAKAAGNAAAAAAQLAGNELAPWQRSCLQPQLERLRTIPEWAALLR